MTVLIVPNSSKIHAIQLMEQVVCLLVDDGIKVLVEPQFAAMMPENPKISSVTLEEGLTMCDVVATIGGDGTMLHTARKALPYQKPLLGINVGRLGFLTIIEHNEIDKLHRLAAGAYLVEERSMIEATGTFFSTSFLALNDIVLTKKIPQKMITLNIFCDDIRVSSFQGDGVVFSTPTGSTAYSMSAGGPILDAHSNGFVVTPICPHVVRAPSMVFEASRTIRVVTSTFDEVPVLLICDGIDGPTLAMQEEVFIKQAKIRVPLIQFADAGQLNSIDKKLLGR